MGEVYRATDTKLNRDVAIKTLIESFTQEKERVARFQREAEILASLNHPNIAAIYGLEESESGKFLVLELVEGETLAERLKRGPLSVGETLDICKQIGEALEAAHEKGIVHRDLKPGNIKVDQKGQVKVLDFGLAKALPGGESQSLPNDSDSPTITDHMTGPGVILGTAAYMSPEQARGKPVDHRTDIWGLGCIMFECLAGKRVIQEESVAETLGAILHQEPDWTALPSTLSQSLHRVLRRCLVKDRRNRIHAIADVRIELSDAIRKDSEIRTQPLYPENGQGPNRLRGVHLVWACVTVLAALSVFLISRRIPAGDVDSPPPIQSVFRSAIQLAKDAPLASARFMPWGTMHPNIALSPDGNTLVYAGENGTMTKLYQRQLDQFEWKAIEGSEGGYNPFFSPDGKWVGFLVPGKIKRVSVRGGRPLTVCDTGVPYGVFWGSDGYIHFDQNRVSVESQEVETLPKANVPLGSGVLGRSGSNGVPLPGGRNVLFTAYNGGVSADHKNLVLHSMNERTNTSISIKGFHPRFLSNRYLIFARSGGLHAAPFDIGELRVTGEEIPLIDRVLMSSIGYPCAQMAMSERGRIVYAAGDTSDITHPVWVHKNGMIEPLPIASRVYGTFYLSPDGQRIAIKVAEQFDELWVYDVDSGDGIRLECDGSPLASIWTPDGKSLLVTTEDPERARLFEYSVAALNNPPREIHSSTTRIRANSVSPNGEWILLEDGFGVISALSRTNPGEKKLVVETRYSYLGSFSPDGKWVAYSGRTQARPEVFVVPFEGGDPIQVSFRGGEEPVWSPDGDSLYYRDRDAWYQVSYSTDLGFKILETVKLLEGAFVNTPGISYALHPDDEKFLMLQPASANASVTELQCVDNWHIEVEEKYRKHAR